MDVGIRFEMRTGMSLRRYQDNHLASHALCGELLQRVSESANVALSRPIIRVMRYSGE